MEEIVVSWTIGAVLILIFVIQYLSEQEENKNKLLWWPSAGGETVAEGLLSGNYFHLWGDVGY